MRKNRTAEFHKGVDYACVMLRGQTTENPSVMLYGTSEEVIYYGELITAAINAKVEKAGK